MTVTPGASVQAFSAFRDFSRQEQERREKRIAAVRAALAEGGALSADDFQRVARMAFGEFPKVITAHRGHAGAVRLKSLRSTLGLFKASSLELEGLLDEFHNLSGVPEFHYRSHKGRAESLGLRIRKEIFCFSELAHSVQDHCRPVRKIWDAPDFAAQLAAHFGTDGLHEFIVKLRNAMHHERMFEANWELRWSGPDARSSHYQFSKAELLEDDVDWERGEPYLRAAPEKIDVRTLVAEYVRRHDAFYAWYTSWCEANLPQAVEEYRALKREHERGNGRSGWKVMLNIFLQRGIDPVPFLPRYLSEDELRHASSLPARSAALADFVIACVDEREACDDELRGMVHKLFAVPAEA